MSLKCKVVLVWVICLSCKVVVTGCEVVLVNRNVTDSFHVGKDGCTNGTRVCTDFGASCQSDGLCLCRVSERNFRKPTRSKAYGCLRSDDIRAGIGSIHCVFGPFQLIPYRHQDPSTKFSEVDNPNVALKSCSLNKAEAKFPDNVAEMELQWLNESYVNLTIANKTLHFKWKRSVPSLRGTIIALHLWCTLSSEATVVPKCLRAKVLGTWPAVVDPLTTEPTVTSTQPKTASPVTVTTVKTAKPKSTSSGSSDEECSESNASNAALIAILAISLVVNVFLGIIVGFLWKKIQRMKDNNLEMKEIQNIDNQRRANSENGIHNDGIYDESFPSSGHNNNNARLSDHKYEEPSNYESLKRNHLQDQSDDHNYQSLTTSRKGK